MILNESFSLRYMHGYYLLSAAFIWSCVFGILHNCQSTSLLRVYFKD